MSNEAAPAPAAPVAASEGSPEKNATAPVPQEGEAKAIKEAVKEAERKFKLKYGKTEREVNEKDLIALAQKSWASDEKFQNTAKKEKQILGLIEKFKDDPDAFIRHLGHDPSEVYRKQLAKELRRKVMTPEQQELEDAREKLKQYETEKKDNETKAHADKLEKLTEHYIGEYDREMSTAITSAGLPKTPKTIKRCAELQYRNLEMGLELPWSTITEMVREEYKSDMKDLFGSAEADKLVEMFGPEVAKKITSASLKKRVAEPEPVNEETRKVSKTGKVTEDKPIGNDEWEEKMKKWKNS